MEGFDLIIYRIKEALTVLFTYDEETSLIFSTSHFWFFFAGVILVVHFYRDKIFYRNLFLVIFSLFFYYKSSHIYIILLILSTCTDYYLGKLIHANRDNRQKKTMYLVFSLFVNLGLLAYFKYSFFIVESINYMFGTQIVPVDYFAMFYNHLFDGSLPVAELIIPVGISFYTFQTLSYSIDLYRGKVEPVKNIIDFGFYVTYFPQLVAGPIVRANEFIPQIYEKYSLTAKEFGYGLSLILTGLIKKVFIADYLASTFVDGVFQNPLNYTGAENLFGIYGYALRIYGDFSGYSDMAIGLALIMGFRLNMNFNSPYRALSITDFWRRWHISLSSWLKDYLYIPLGGNKGTSLFAYIAIPLIGFILVSSDGLFPYDAFVLPILLVFWVCYLILGKQFPQFSYVVFMTLIGFTVMTIFTSTWYASLYFALITAGWGAMIFRPNTKKDISTYVNLELTMLLGGIWHGPSLNFIIWGALHGVALGINKLWSTIFKTDIKSGKWFNAFSWIITFHFVLFCWIFFRAADYKIVEDMLSNIWNNFGLEHLGDIIYSHRYVMLMIVFGFAVHFYPKSKKMKLYNSFGSVPDLVKALVIVIVILVCYQMRTAGVQPFIYFQF